MFIVVDVGCLECGYPTVVEGPYESEAEARQAHPTAVERVVNFGETVFDEDESYDSRVGWNGEGVKVIYRYVAEPQNRSE